MFKDILESLCYIYILEFTSIKQKNVLRVAHTLNCMKLCYKCLIYIILQLTMVELQTDVPMIRNGSQATMVIMEIHHSDDNINESNKKDIGRQLADAMMETLKVSLDR